MTRRLLTIVLAVSGSLVVARMVRGPFTLLVPVNSPLNVEICFALAAILLLATGLRKGVRSASPRRRGWRDIPIMISAAAAALAGLARSASVPFLSDDFVLLRHARAMRSSGYTLLTRGGGDGFFRPAGMLFFWMNSAWAGVSPWRWHWTGFALHAANAVLVCSLAAALGFSPFAVALAGLLFALHATRPEAALWVAGRFDLLATFFTLISLLLFLRSFQSRPAWFRAAAAVAMVAGVLSKESAYAVPLVILVLAWQRRAWRTAVPFLALAGGLLVWRWLLLGGMGGYPGATSPGVAGPIKALLLRLPAVLIFPVNWSRPAGLALAVAAALYLGALILLFSVRPARDRLVFPLGLLVAAALPPVQQLLIGADLQKARLLYLPSAGFCLLLAACSEYLSTRWRWFVAAALVAFQVAALQHNLEIWRDVGERAAAVCSAAARSGQSRLPGLPGSIDGVYFFANGFEECVAMHAPPRPSGP
jgi:hypothetical protein